MPGVNRLGWRHGLIDSVREARSFGVNQVVIFPKVRQNLAVISAAVNTSSASTRYCNTIAYTYHKIFAFNVSWNSCKHLYQAEAVLM